MASAGGTPFFLLGFRVGGLGFRGLGALTILTFKACETCL